jgi:glycosyltransferase involved in cell wall biosynthesis
LRRIDQFVPSLALHDAIGSHVLQLRRLLREAGFESEVFYEHLDPRLSGEARPYTECDARPDPDRLILYHASTHTDMTGWLVSASQAGQRVVVDYHNITPAEYFARWEPQAARSMQLGRAQLTEVAPHATAGLADSEYNARELETFGVAGAVACPILLDLEEYHREPDPAVAGRLGDGPVWLFVGRLAPNKCQHDVVASFALYRRLFAPDARLAVVGGVTSERYRHALERMVADLSLEGAVDLPGSAPFAELLGYFHRADVFVCLSEHEGFCVPVIEAMELGVPVVAYAAAAVTETVADAGVLLRDKDPLAVAVAVDSLLSDPDRRDAVVAAGRARAATFALAPTADRWLTELRRIDAAAT